MKLGGGRVKVRGKCDACIPRSMFKKGLYICYLLKRIVGFCFGLRLACSIYEQCCHVTFRNNDINQIISTIYVPFPRCVQFVQM